MSASVLVEAWGIAGFCIGLFGFYLLAHKRAAGWDVRIVGSVVVLAYNIYKVSWGNIFGTCAFIGVTLYGKYQWRQAARGRHSGGQMAKVIDDG